MTKKAPVNSIKIIAKVVYGIVVLLLLLTYIISKRYQIPFKEITGDPASIFKAHPFTGIVSNIGVLLWCATCAILLFSYVALRKIEQKHTLLFLLFSGMITGILLIDDLFMLHDYIFYSFGMNQNTMYTLYLIIFITYFIYYRALIIKAPGLTFLTLALFFLTGSVVLDIFVENVGIQYFFEDGLKLLGIANWFLFFASYSLLKITAYLKELNLHL